MKHYMCILCDESVHEIDMRDHLSEHDFLPYNTDWDNVLFFFDDLEQVS